MRGKMRLTRVFPFCLLRYRNWVSYFSVHLTVMLHLKKMFLNNFVSKHSIFIPSSAHKYMGNCQPCKKQKESVRNLKSILSKFSASWFQTTPHLARFSHWGRCKAEAIYFSTSLCPAFWACEQATWWWSAESWLPHSLSPSPGRKGWHSLTHNPEAGPLSGLALGPINPTFSYGEAGRSSPGISPARSFKGH